MVTNAASNMSEIGGHENSELTDNVFEYVEIQYAWKVYKNS
jgi:hypothetical protein